MEETLEQKTAKYRAAVAYFLNVHNEVPMSQALAEFDQWLEEVQRPIGGYPYDESWDDSWDE